MKTKHFNCTIGNEVKTVPLVISKKQALKFAKAHRAFLDADARKATVSTGGWVKNHDPTVHDRAQAQFKAEMENIYQTVNYSIFLSQPVFNEKEFNFVVEALKDSTGVDNYKSSKRRATAGVFLRSIASAVIGYGVGGITYFSSAFASSPTQLKNSLAVGITATVLGIISSVIYGIKRRNDAALNMAKNVQITIQNAISDFRPLQETSKEKF